MTIEERVKQTIQRISKLGDCGYMDFEWPQFNHEIERIKYITEHTMEDSIPVVFRRLYPTKLSRSFINKYEDIDYKEILVGDTISLYISEVNKKGVIFDQGNYKENIECCVNLYQYPKFREWLPTSPIECKVISKTNNRVVVDPFASMLDEWISEHTTNLREQYHIDEDRSIKVQSLRLTRGGYLGKVRIDNISDFCGKDVYFEAFIPGSHIVLNIENDFERWNGCDVNAFITNYTTKPGSTNMTLICSVKEYLKFQGQKNIIEWFKDYTESNERWDTIKNTIRKGKITGVCHTQNKCGVFVELVEDNITGMINVEPDVLNTFHRGEDINIKIESFDEPMKYNPDVDQVQHLDPYIIEDGILKKCLVRIVLEQA